MNSQSQSKNKRTVLIALSVVVGMFGFGFALVPLYDVFCRITGLNGKVELQASVVSGQVDRQRQVKLQMVTVNNESMPWQFKAKESSVLLSPGELFHTSYRAKNGTANPMVAQAIPSVSPSAAAPFVQKVNCFCFEQQPLAPDEEKDMPLVVSIDPALPEDIKTITLSYTLFDITPQSKNQLVSNSGREL